MPRIEIAGESAYILRSHFSQDLLEELQDYTKQQDSRKKVHHLRHKGTPDVLRRAAQETMRKTSIGVNLAVVKRYDEGTPEHEYRLRRPDPNFLFGGIVAVSLTNVTLMEVTGEDGEIHPIDCFENTAVVMMARLQNRIFRPQEEGPRHVIMLGQDAIAAVRSWYQPDAY